MRVLNLRNISDKVIEVSLTNGAAISIPPHCSITNADIVEVDSLRGKIKFKEDLTEVVLPSGKTRLLD